MKCPLCQQENPSHASFCLKCGTPLGGPVTSVASYADPHAEIEGLRRALGESLEQQTATSEILRVISQSPTDAQPIFDAIVRNASRLCGGEWAIVTRYDGELLHLVAQHNPRPGFADETAKFFPQAPRREGITPRAFLDARMVHVPDVDAEELEPSTREFYGRIGLRAALAMPMIHEGRPIGVVSVSRGSRGPFSDRQIALLQTFADQAVIAIENVRLFKELERRNLELTEALDRQTATAAILRVISSSPTDLQPVMDVVAQNAARVCSAADASIFRIDGDVLRRVAQFGLLPHSMPVIPLTREIPTARSVIDRQTIHIADVQPLIETEFRGLKPNLPAQQDLHTILATPLMREGAPIGAILIRRIQVQPFTDKQVDLLKTFADQAVIAIENVRLFKELETRNGELTEALDRQTSTADILRVISRSPTDIQQVFDTIVRSASRLCAGHWAVALRFDGELIHLAAQHNIGLAAAEFEDLFPRSPSRSLPLGRAILERELVHIADAADDPELAPGVVRRARSFLIAPMLREGAPIGAIAVSRPTPGPFPPSHIELLRSFADQAVIAIENVRLFKELQEKNADLTEALAQQTATAEILRVISASPTDVQPVFETIAARAMRLCDATVSNVFRFDGTLIHLAAMTNRDPNAVTAVGEVYPMPPGRSSGAARAVFTRGVVQIPDVLADPDYGIAHAAGTAGFRSVLSVPMLRDGTPLGAINVGKADPGPFTDEQVALLQTFADQAVIAIENVRLFTELQASNRDLTTALDTQTATSDILRVISRSQTDVQPVFDAIVASAVRLLGAYSGTLTRIAGEQIELAAITSTSDVGDAALRARFPQPLSSAGPHARTIRDRAPLNIADAHTDPRLPEAVHAYARVRGYRSQVAVPMLRHDEAIGTISLTRGEPGGFTDDEIGLLQTFADQAVIAIENVRLFKELEARTQELTRSVGELRALGEVGQAISSTLDLRAVLSTIVARATQLSGTDAGVIYEYDEPREVFMPRATEHLEAEIVETMLATPVRKGEGATGRLAEIPEPIQVPDILAAPAESRVRGALVRAGYRALLAVPLVRDDHLLGGLTVIRKAPGAFAPEVIELLRTFATQSALAIQNARLFLEIEEKSRQLEIASQHKSEFLANMSHELRTPLNAIIGFSEVLGERMFGDLNEKQDEYLKDIYASGQHLLSLINDILDLSKIEAGRMELELTDFNLPATLDNALTLVRERAGRRGIALGLTVDERLEQIRADERKVRQVVLNLLSNAIKFTPEGGRIEVRAVPVDGMVEISVSDTGVGIAPEDQEAIFEEFRQVGTAAKKVEGTGLGLALSRKFVELHGGRIWVKSEVGAGSTFTFTIPPGHDLR